MKIIIQTLILLSFLPAFSQTENKEIQRIRDRYYRINGASVSLDIFKFDNIKFYLENNELVKIKLSEDLETYEFYYDKDRYGDYYPYFSYLNPKSGSPEIRAYYNQEIDLLLYKIDEDEISLTGYRRPDEEILLKSINSLNRFLNICSANLNKRDSEIERYEKELKRLEEVQIARVDTIKNEIHTEGTYDAHYLVRYKDKAGRIIKEKEENITDHVWEQSTTFHNENGKFYTLTKSITTFNTSRIIESREYFHFMQSIKKVTFDNYEIQIKQTRDKEKGYIFDFRDFIPRIEYPNDY